MTVAMFAEQDPLDVNGSATQQRQSATVIIELASYGGGPTYDIRIASAGILLPAIPLKSPVVPVIVTGGSAKWRVRDPESLPAWIPLVQTEGMSGEAISWSAQNNTGEPRAYDIVIEHFDNPSLNVTLPVIQQGESTVYTVKLSADAIVLPPTPLTSPVVPVTVTGGSAKWRVRDPETVPAWIPLTQTEGESGEAISWSAQDNTGDPRDYDIIVEHFDNPAVYEKLPVVQQGQASALNVGVLFYVIDSLSGQTVIGAKVKVQWRNTSGEGVSAIQEQEQTGSGLGIRITDIPVSELPTKLWYEISADGYPTESETINVTYPEGGGSIRISDIKLARSAYKVEVASAGVILESVPLRSPIVPVTVTGGSMKWRVRDPETVPAWIPLAQTEGESGEAISWGAQNNTGDPRAYDIVIEHFDDPDINVTLPVSQKGNRTGFFITGSLWDNVSGAAEIFGDCLISVIGGDVDYYYVTEERINSDGSFNIFVPITQEQYETEVDTAGYIALEIVDVPSGFVNANLHRIDINNITYENAQLEGINLFPIPIPRTPELFDGGDVEGILVMINGERLSGAVVKLVFRLADNNDARNRWPVSIYSPTQANGYFYQLLDGIRLSQSVDTCDITATVSAGSYAGTYKATVRVRLIDVGGTIDFGEVEMIKQ